MNQAGEVALNKTLQPLTSPIAGNGGEVINLYGSGPLPIASRGRPLSTAALANQPMTVRVWLARRSGQSEAESLLRYVKNFGQGYGSVGTINGDWWLELTDPKDAHLVSSQFKDLLAEREPCNGRAHR